MTQGKITTSGNTEAKRHRAMASGTSARAAVTGAYPGEISGMTATGALSADNSSSADLDHRKTLPLKTECIDVLI